MTRSTEVYEGRNLQLLAVTSLFPPAVGGASEDFRLLTEAWERSQSVERIVILTERRKDCSAREVKGKTVVRRVLPVTSCVQKKLGLVYVANRLWTYALMTILVAWHLYRERMDVVMIHGRYGKKSFLKVLKLMGARVVVLLSDHFRSPEDLADCDAIICITENVYERAKSRVSGACNVYYVFLPFECPQVHPRRILEAANTPYFLFVGEVSRWKGVDVLLEAFEAFRKDHAEYSLLLAGPIRDGTLFATECPRTRFLGEVDHENALDLIQQAIALILPSRSEGLPRVCLEAIALGTKTICPPGIPELQRACPEWILSDITPREIIEKLRQAIGLPFRSSFDFKNYNPEITSNRILEICITLSQDGHKSSRKRDDKSILPRLQS